MKIGVIGIGEMGGTIARRWSEKGHSVRVANSRGPEAVKQFADEIGADAADIYGAVEGADVVLLSMPFPAVAKLPNDLFNRAAEGVVIIDTGNYYPDVRDAHIPEIDAGMPESVWISQQLGRPIFKAFNSIMFHALSELGKPEGSPDRLAIPVAGDDARAKQIVMGLVNDMGFDPVDGGSLGGIVAAAAFNARLLLRLWRGKDAGRDQGSGQGQGGEDTRQCLERELWQALCRQAGLCRCPCRCHRTEPFPKSTLRPKFRARPWRNYTAKVHPYSALHGVAPAPSVGSRTRSFCSETHHFRYQMNLLPEGKRKSEKHHE